MFITVASRRLLREQGHSSTWFPAQHLKLRHRFPTSRYERWHDRVTRFLAHGPDRDSNGTLSHALEVAAAVDLVLCGSSGSRACPAASTEVNMPEVEPNDAEVESALRKIRVLTTSNRPRWGRRIVLTLLIAVVIGSGTWQVVTLNNKVSNLQTTVVNQRKLINESTSEIAHLKSSFGAAVGCLQTPQAQQGLCSQFAP